MSSTLCEREPQTPGAWRRGPAVTETRRTLVLYRGRLGLEVIDRVANHHCPKQVTAVTSKAVRHRGGIERMPSRIRPRAAGAVHIGSGVDEVDAVATRAAELGCLSRSRHPVNINSRSVAGSCSCSIQDPDGFMIELFLRAAA